MISEIVPGRIWFEGDVGPFEVPEARLISPSPDGRCSSSPRA